MCARTYMCLCVLFANPALVSSLRTRLQAAGLELPRSIVAHGWWMKDGQKISKSLGNALEPRDVVSNFSLDAFRYFLCRESNILSDGNYSDVLMVAHNNADLADDLGNLVRLVLRISEARTTPCST